jgi:hypothetical protein
MHRFVWDLRYKRSGDGSVDDDDEENVDYPGPFVLPGTYKVKLTTSAGTLEQPLQVVADPRSAATPVDRTQQFQWARRTFDEIVAVQKLASEVTAKRKAATTTELEGFQKQLAAVTRDLTAALTAMNSSDRAPTSQSIALFHEATGKFADLQKRWPKL